MGGVSACSSMDAFGCKKKKQLGYHGEDVLHGGDSTGFMVYGDQVSFITI
jgi:hypothetical protein